MAQMNKSPGEGILKPVPSKTPRLGAIIWDSSMKKESLSTYVTPYKMHG